MIDSDRFFAALALLAGAHRNPIGEAMQLAYFDTLTAAGLTTEDVERAVSASLAQDKFWPSAARLVELAGFDIADGEARAAFRELRADIARHGGYRFYPHDRFAALPEPVRAGIRRVGGVQAISNMHEDREAAVVRQFCDAYRDPAKEFAAPKKVLALTGARARALPRGGEPTRLGEITDVRQAPIFDGPRAPRDEYSPEYLAAVRAAQAYFATRSDRVNVIRAGIRRQHPSLPDDHIQFRYQLEAALVAAWRTSERQEAAR